jgi:hypothetical protein
LAAIIVRDEDLEVFHPLYLTIKVENPPQRTEAPSRTLLIRVL